MVNSKTQSLHNHMPAVFDTENNDNWKAIIEAIGNNDEEIADLIEEIRKQFSVKSAINPYLDRIGARSKVQRPRFVGMDDETFRDFIPVMSYQPKQVKLILDKLLDLFFFKEATTSFTESAEFEPFNLTDGFRLTYEVDAFRDEDIQFNTGEFVNIAAATADEVVGAINRQAQYSFAIKQEDSVNQITTIRIFTKTIGSKGAIRITGGLANINLRFDGFNTDAGNGTNTEWTVTKTGETMSFENTAGDDPGLSSVEIGDIVLINLTGNVGSFFITDLDVSNNKFFFKNLLGTAGILTQTSSDDVKFLKDITARVYKRDRRALTWEVSPGEIILEVPPSPPVVKRNRIGAGHINGVVSLMTSRVSDTSIEVVDATDFPSTGAQFIIEKVEEIKTELSPTEETSHLINGRLINEIKYTYTGKSSNTLTGVTPDLPILASLNKINLTSASRTSDVLTLILAAPTSAFTVGEYAIVDGVSGSVTIDGSWKVTEITDSTTIKLESLGINDTSTGGTVRVEKIGLAAAGSKVMLRSSIIKDNTEGPFLWDSNANFILSSFTTTLTEKIFAGDTTRNIQVNVNDLPDEEGLLIFDFGTEKQEGPVRYFYKSSATSIAIDPAFVFQYTHEVGSAVTMIRQKGGIAFNGTGSERAPYITDPSSAREVLEELMKEVKSTGVFLNFLVRYPQQLYATLDVYRSGVDPG